MSTIATLQPTALWQNFDALNKVPRASKKEQQVIAFIEQFATANNLPYITDAVGNVIITKPATIGLESKPTLCLQSHLDMVHQKNNDTSFDFATQGIDMYIDGDWVKAKGTTLGADNGIGVAAIMALLQSTHIPHPALEALFTIDEETGMTGAKQLQPNVLKANIMLNLDTEEDDELTIGCAGGIDVTGIGNYSMVDVPSNYSTYTITLKGLTGGHSGMDIHKGRGNANKLLNRVLFTLVQNNIAFGIINLQGGSLRNAIPREANTTIALDATAKNKVAEIIHTLATTLKQEYTITDPKLELTIADGSSITAMCTPQFTKQWIQCIYALPNGIYRMDSKYNTLVQSSNNVSKLQLQDGSYNIQCLTRSSVDTEKTDVVNCITNALAAVNATVQLDGVYPGWAPKPNSNLVDVFVAVYKKLHNNQAPKVNAVHAGLECGILGEHYPAMEMISFGPTIHGAHSPDEKVCISSVQKFWNYLQQVIQVID